MSLDFDSSQRRAIEHVHGPILVVAGAGTGKTEVMVQRIARLIREQHARPDEILALTYAEDAAASLARRVREKLAGQSTEGLRVENFHQYCFGLLHRRGHGFRVILKEDLWVHLRQRIDQLGLSYYIRAASPGEFLNALLDFFERCHDELVDVERYEKYVEEVCAGKHALPRVTRSSDFHEMAPEEVLERCREIAGAFRKVEQMLAADNLGTFGHQIARARKLLGEDPKALAEEREHARFILIDEFQDANVAQIEVVHLLAGEEQNVFAVGDPDQAIYRFRGASSATFEEFRRRFPRTTTIVLEKNYRSTSRILNSAFAVISHNPEGDCAIDGGGRLFERKALVSAREEQARKQGKPLASAPVEVVINQERDDEAFDVAEEISRLTAGIAVLYRVHSHRDAIVSELAQRNIPFVVTGIDALETGEVRDLLACLRAIHSPGDSEGLFRMAALPVFALDGEAVRQQMQAAGKNPDMRKVLTKVPGGEKVLAALEEARITANQAGTASAALTFVVRNFGFNTSSAAVVAFRNFVATWEAKPFVKRGGLPEFLEYMKYYPQANGMIAVAPEEHPANGAVQLMTAHAAKGLEFDRVFLLRANSGSFPLGYRETLFEFPPALREFSLQEQDEKTIQREEERRLFYVAMTRARDGLSIYAKPGTGRDKTPSGFLRDLLKPEHSRNCKSRPARPYRALLAAASEASGVGAWLLSPPAPAQERMALSVSRISRYETCPLSYKLDRDWNIPGHVAGAMQYGNAVHTTLKAFYDAVLAGRPQTVEQFLQCFRDAMAAMSFEDPVQLSEYLKQGDVQLRAFFERRGQEAVPAVKFTEQGFQIPVGDVQLRGRIDRIDDAGGGRVRIIDYKTGSPREPKEAKESLQLSVYALAAQRQGMDVAELAFYNLEGNSIVTTRRDQADLKAAEQRVQEVAEKIRREEFDAKPGFHCRSCLYRNLCPETEERIYTVAAAQAAGS